MYYDGISLQQVEIPEFGLPKTEPVLGRAEYAARIAMARARAAGEGLDYLLVYGDREHFANITFLTGYDPRFEESLFLIPVGGGKPILLVGNEGVSYAHTSPAEIDTLLYQGFSLLGQPRARSPRLAPVLEACGLRRGQRVGMIGWKYASTEESDDPAHWLDAPTFITDAVRALVGDAALVTNATALLMNPVDGLRVRNSANQLAAFEFGAVHCSRAVRRLITALTPGITELEAVEQMGLNGLPLTAHLMFSAGPRALVGLPSPTTRIIRRGEPFFIAYGLRGGLTARGGFVAAAASELSAESAGYLDKLVTPYFAAIVAWYETVGIGVTGGQMQAAVDAALSASGMTLALNAGHNIHLDEWVHSGIFAGSDISLCSGNLLQSDLIPSAQGVYGTTNAEDTIALADDSLQAELAQQYPDLMERVARRRTFMQETLGIRLRPEVLPFSNFPAILSPFSLSPQMVMTAR